MGSTVAGVQQVAQKNTVGTMGDNTAESIEERVEWIDCTLSAQVPTNPSQELSLNTKTGISLEHFFTCPLKKKKIQPYGK